MGISLREWLIIGGVIVIALILFDGWRRVRASRQQLRLDIDRSLSGADDAQGDHPNPELPNGGARVRKISDEPFEQVPLLSDELGRGVDSVGPSKEPELGDLSFSALEPEVAPTAPSTAVSAVDDTPIAAEPVETLPQVDLNADQISVSDPYRSMLEDEQNKPPALSESAVIDATTAKAAESVPEPELPDNLSVDELQDEMVRELQRGIQIARAEAEAAARQREEADSQTPDAPVEAVVPPPSAPPQPEPAEESPVVTEHSPVASEAVQPVPEQTPRQLSVADLDPLFDEIPEDYTPPARRTRSAEKSSPKRETDYSEWDSMGFDFDLEKPLSELENEVSEADPVNTEKVSRASRRKEKRAARKQAQETPTLSLPLNDTAEETDTSAVSLQLEADDSAAIEPLASIDPEPRVESAAPLPSSTDFVELEPEPVTEPEAATAKASTASGNTGASAPRKAITDLPDPEEMLVITVVGRNRGKMPGSGLKKIVEACGMEFGDMSIYHRFEDKSPMSPVQFSMANAVNPGTFDPETMMSLETPAVSFFMSMREPRDAMNAYECMLATAETVARHLDGDLLDEDRSVMREQTKEHYRQRIRDFDMLSRRKLRNR